MYRIAANAVAILLPTPLVVVGAPILFLFFFPFLMGAHEAWGGAGELIFTVVYVPWAVASCVAPSVFSAIVVDSLFLVRRSERIPLWRAAGGVVCVLLALPLLVADVGIVAGVGFQVASIWP